LKKQEIAFLQEKLKDLEQELKDYVDADRKVQEARNYQANKHYAKLVPKKT